VARHDRLCVIVALATLTLSGCGARGDAASAPTLTTTTPATTTSTVPSPAPITGLSTPPPVGDTQCTSDMVSGSIEPQNAAAGNRNAVLVVLNTSAQVCTLQGYGGLELLDATRAPLPTNALRNLDPVPTRVILRPGATAGKLLHWSVVATGDEPAQGPCRPSATAINVVLPDETETFEVDFDFGPVCDEGRIDTSAYFPK
jgi:hypothetical protein